MTGYDAKRSNPRFNVTLDRATIRIIERVRKKVLMGESRSAAIRYLARHYDEARRSGPHATS